MNRQSLSPLTSELSAYIAQAPRKALPAAGGREDEHHVLDTLAAMVSGLAPAAGPQRRFPVVKSLDAQAGAASPAAASSPTRSTRRWRTACRARRHDGRLACRVAHPPRLRRGRRRRSRDGRARQAARAACAAWRSGYDVGCRLTLSLDPYRFPRGGSLDAQLGPTFGAAAAARRSRARRRAQVRCSVVRGAAGVRASRAGCATRSTSRRRSISAACRRATASPPRPWSAHGFTGRRGRVLRRAQLLRRLRPRQSAEALVARPRRTLRDPERRASSAGRSALRSRRRSIRC